MYTLPLLLLLICSVDLILSANLDGSDTVGVDGMVASSNFLASEAGVKVLRNGGSAADAAVAIQMVLNVVQPSSAGLGGGTLIMYYDANTDKVYAIDGREEAPQSYNPYVFCKDIKCFEQFPNAPDSCDNCEPLPFTERKTGGLSVGVPGTLASIQRLYSTFGGKVGWKDLFCDAIDIATNGFKMYDELYEWINLSINELNRFPSTCKLILNYPHCNAPKFAVGEIVTFPDLAYTLQLLSNSDDSSDAIDIFYKGEIAQAMIDQLQTDAINTVTDRGGLMDFNDIANYRAVFREPIRSDYMDEYSVYGMNMPSSGPLTQQYALKLLEILQEDDYFEDFEGSDLENEDIYSARLAHYVYSASNIAFADRNEYMADADFVDVPIDGLQDDDYLLQRAKDFLLETANLERIPFGIPDGVEGDKQPQTEDHEMGTCHYNVVDQYGNMASITTTVEGLFGSSYVLDGYGLFLNNELTDFASVGIVDGKQIANGPEGGKKARKTAIDIGLVHDSELFGGKRPRSSMSPTIVLRDNEPYLAIGSPGGATIIGTTLLMILRMLTHDIGPQLAIDSARIWGVNSSPVLLELNLWNENNEDFEDDLVAIGYTEDRLINRDATTPFLGAAGRPNAIRIGGYNSYKKRTSWKRKYDGSSDYDDVVLFCGADIQRWGPASCMAVSDKRKSHHGWKKQNKPNYKKKRKKKKKSHYGYY